MSKKDDRALKAKKTKPIVSQPPVGAKTAMTPKAEGAATAERKPKRK